MQLGFLLFVLLLISKTWCSLQPLPDELSTRLSLAQCIAKAGTIFIPVGEIILVSLPIRQVGENEPSAVMLNQLLFNTLFSLCYWPLIVIKPSNKRIDESYQVNIQNYIVQVRQITELNHSLQKLEKYSSWNPHAKFMVVSVTVFEDNMVAASKFVEQLWAHKVANGIILLPSADDTTVFETYSWFPFDDGNCGQNFSKLRIVDRCRFGKMTNGNGWFSNKIPHNLNGCPIYIRTVVWPPYVLPPDPNVVDEYRFSDGLEILLVNTMAEVAHFRVVYTTSEDIQDWGQIFLNGSATGLMLHMKNEESDIGIGAIAASKEANRYFDAVTYPIPESLKWCVAKAKLIPSWKYFFNVIQPETYLCVIFAFFAVSICMWRLSRYRPGESTSYKSFQSCAQNMFGAMLNVPIKIVPRTNFLRAMFLVWIFFTLHINVAYQTFLMSVFSHPQYEHQLNTVEELFNNNLSLWCLPTYKQFFNNKDWVTLNVMRQWKDCTDINKCLHFTAYEQTAATCTPRLYLKYISNLYVDKDHNSLLHCFENSIATFPLQMLMRKGFPFHRYFSKLVGWISAAGFTAHWEKKIFQYIEEEDLSDLQEDSRALFTIEINHLILLFVMLGVSYVVGLIVLLLEIYYDKKKISQLPYLK
ncbi:hypothetical protein PPYR_06034 [Photinus pyralis]|uniref:Ionotropic glutamate receptor C-terminal domain-containing protein n=1 Tax=Photinus pyralis TaxID=7054 RepID=A0A5N4ASH4_PHOPY|nr:uncharacterized protein LOC116167457 [Photinus pyralis]KAB0800294.1 hypothetical protein PPYR_06034 [Photinus pyralis]